MFDSNFSNNFKAALSYTATPMPVTLTAFPAQGQGIAAVLSWATANETDNAGYEIQASAEGQAFEVVGFVAPATASSQTAHSYPFRDRDAGKTGLRYYRLRQVDLDGSSTFSPVRTGQCGLAASQRTTGGCVRGAPGAGHGHAAHKSGEGIAAGYC